MIDSIMDSETPRVFRSLRSRRAAELYMLSAFGADSDLIYSTENVGLWKNTSVPYRWLAVRKISAHALGKS